ncbi:TPA: RlfB protein [Haemophilus influenzae]
MLDEILDLNKIESKNLFDYLYSIFYSDFVENKTYLAEKIYIDPKSHDLEGNKEKVFWHLTSRENKEAYWEQGVKRFRSLGRYLDFRRAERIHWVKEILENHSHEKIKLFYHRESNKKRDIRLYLWAYKDDFVVILQKLGKFSSFLVTSFYTDHQGKRDDYQKRYEKYRNGDETLKGCEWF